MGVREEGWERVKEGVEPRGDQRRIEPLVRAMARTESESVFLGRVGSPSAAEEAGASTCCGVVASSS